MSRLGATALSPLVALACRRGRRRPERGRRAVPRPVRRRGDRPQDDGGGRRRAPAPGARARTGAHRQRAPTDHHPRRAGRDRRGHTAPHGCRVAAGSAAIGLLLMAAGAGLRRTRARTCVVNLFVVGWRPASTPTSAEARAPPPAREAAVLPRPPDRAWPRRARPRRPGSAMPTTCRTRRRATARSRSSPAGRSAGPDDDAADGRAPADARFFLEPADALGGHDRRPLRVRRLSRPRRRARAGRPTPSAPTRSTRRRRRRALVLEQRRRAARADGRPRAAARVARRPRGRRLAARRPPDLDRDRARASPARRCASRRDGETRQHALPAGAGRAARPRAGRGGCGEAPEAATAALADWPGRPNVVPVTGGRDSRVVLAAALRRRAGVRGRHRRRARRSRRADGPGARAAAGVPHSLLPAGPAREHVERPPPRRARRAR